ncbi:hypothetical protein DCS_00921 [Drechmeria coniospora]|uniref:Uncharacterized protein n=1 Tax=Drechmeria coniospora TaxID=98403 RepID=A0A151GRP3_DRECN|nr:hypothetical protein DCS_00921 [Drechmeria coniospora]KYK59787.1 hypothetical protein DCS_00921 [Drechmeria coniospora]
MATAHAASSLAPVLRVLPPAQRRFASTALRPRPRGTTAKRPAPARRFIPEAAERFIGPKGQLLTTRENVDFIVANDLEPDNGTMARFTPGPEMKRIAADFGVALAFSPRHVIHPFDLRAFDPRGHPLAAMKRAQLARKIHEDSLWIIMTSAGGVSAVVRSMTQNKLVKELHLALEAMGYRSGTGRGPTKEIRGTFWVTIFDPVKAAGQSAERFGKTVAAALDQECSRRRS